MSLREAASHAHEFVVFFGIIDLIYIWLQSSVKRDRLKIIKQDDSWLTCLRVMRILTSLITCAISWSRFVLILLQATCRYLEGSNARWTVANEPVPRQWEVTIYLPMRWYLVRIVWHDYNCAYFMSKLGRRGGIKYSHFLSLLPLDFNTSESYIFCQWNFIQSALVLQSMFGSSRMSPLTKITDVFLIDCPLRTTPFREKSWGRNMITVVQTGSVSALGMKLLLPHLAIER